MEHEKLFLSCKAPHANLYHVRCLKTQQNKNIFPQRTLLSLV